MTGSRYHLRTFFSLTTAIGALCGWLQLSPWWFPGWWALGGVALCVWSSVFCRDLQSAVRWFATGLFCQYYDETYVLLHSYNCISCTSGRCDYQVVEALQSGFSLPVFVVLGTAGFWLQRGSLRMLRDNLGRISGGWLFWGTASLVTLAITMSEFSANFNRINELLRQELELEQEFRKLKSGGPTTAAARTES